VISKHGTRIFKKYGYFAVIEIGFPYPTPLRPNKINPPPCTKKKKIMNAITGVLADRRAGDRGRGCFQHHKTPVIYVY
jgi:hypothetical protein